MTVANTTKPPRWVVVSKGDVCLLVDSLVTTMIADSSDGGAPGESQQTNNSDNGDDSLMAIPRHSPDGASSAELPSPSAEPRKWKSDLLQRVRKEKQ